MLFHVKFILGCFFAENVENKINLMKMSDENLQTMKWLELMHTLCLHKTTVPKKKYAVLHAKLEMGFILNLFTNLQKETM